MQADVNPQIQLLVNQTTYVGSPYDIDQFTLTHTIRACRTLYNTYFITNSLWKILS